MTLDDLWGQFKEMEGVANMDDQQLLFMKRSFYGGALSSMHLHDIMAQSNTEDEFNLACTNAYDDAIREMLSLGGSPTSMSKH